MAIGYDPWNALLSEGRAFIKMQGLRNHFVIVDGRNEPLSFEASEIARLCDVEVGVGAEQVLVVEPATELGRQAGAAASLRILNIDGCESEACGNASRCVAWLLMAEGGTREIAIETLGGILRCRSTAANRVEIDMGRPRTGWQEVPLSRAMTTDILPIEYGPLAGPAAVSMGNPHATFFVENLDAVDIQRWAPLIQNDALFPEQVNVGVAQLIDEHTVRLSVWERPGILTAACGTGACAACFAAVRRGFTKARQFRVLMRGGTVDIRLDVQGSVLMEGDVAVSFAGRFVQARR